MGINLLTEIIPLAKSECFIISDRTDENIDFPIHYHQEIELNFIHNAAGAKRTIGNNTELVPATELVLIGSGLRHGWSKYKCSSTKIRKITIQFHHDLFSESFLKWEQMNIIRALLTRAEKGILFSEEKALQMLPGLEALESAKGFEAVLKLMSILNELSLCDDFRILSSDELHSHRSSMDNPDLQWIIEYLNGHYATDIEVDAIASMLGLSETSLRQFFKTKTGKSIETVIGEIRIGNAAGMLLKTTHSVSEIAYQCGFRNLSHFYRRFRKNKKCSPQQFRKSLNANQKNTTEK